MYRFGGRTLVSLESLGKSKERFSEEETQTPPHLFKVPLRWSLYCLFSLMLAVTDDLSSPNRSFYCL